MDTNLLSIVDTAVKIGLGALISGIATYTVTRLNHNKEIEKERIKRQRELLEEIASQTEEFSTAVLKYWAYMIEYIRYVESNKEAPEDLDVRIEESGKNLFDKYTNLSSAEGKLILIGATKAQEKIREYGEYVKDFRRKAWQGNKALTESDLDNYREVILNKRKSLYEEIRKVYKK